MSSGRLFQRFGPTETNERSPTVTRRDGRTSSWLEVADRRRQRDGKSATRRRKSDRYRGVVPCRARYTRTASLKLMRSGARSQWKLPTVSVTWSLQRWEPTGGDSACRLVGKPANVAQTIWRWRWMCSCTTYSTLRVVCDRVPTSAVRWRRRDMDDYQQTTARTHCSATTTNHKIAAAVPHFQRSSVHHVHVPRRRKRRGVEGPGERLTIREPKKNRKTQNCFKRNKRNVKMISVFVCYCTCSCRTHHIDVGLLLCLYT